MTRKSDLANAGLLERKDFSHSVFARDKHRCVNCGAAAVDAHHILDRKLWPDGGYYLNNGVSVCGPCHIEAEKTLLSVEALRAAAAITTILVPPGLREDTFYDKWGNEVLADGRRRPGPMFQDDGARKILTEAGLLWSGTFVLEDPPDAS